MFGLITTFLAGPYGFLLKIGAIAAIIGVIFLLGRSSGVESMRPEVEAAHSAADMWRTTAYNRLNLIHAQNSAVEGLKAAHELRVSELNKRLATAILEGQNYRKKAEKKAEAIIALPVSKNECTALTELIDEARK